MSMPDDQAALSSPAARSAHDMLGEVTLPEGALWGASTERARRVFAVGERAMPRALVLALVQCKGAAARVNERLGVLDGRRARAIDDAANAVLGGEHAAQFPLRLWQSGSATQTHMNVNEVLAALATRALGEPVHANDHVNRGQSSNDMVPSAMHVAALQALDTQLLPSLDALAATLAERASAWDGIAKLGRTHLQDAVPLPLGREIGAWRSQVLAGRAAIEHALPALHALAAGGTAVGTGLNTHARFAAEFCSELSLRLKRPFLPAPDAFAALAGQEPLLALHAGLRVLAAALHKTANDLRLLACGPRAGLGELVLAANEPGSSIMPGKVNPTQCEMMVMVCCQIFGNDVAVGLGAAGGQLQLNACKPLIIANVLDSIGLLGDAMASFDRHALRGLVPDEARIAALLERSLMLVTALVPHIGYDRASRLARRAHDAGSSLKEAALAEGVAADDFERWVSAAAMARPRG